jgi:hypothetical protein
MKPSLKMDNINNNKEKKVDNAGKVYPLFENHSQIAMMMSTKFKTFTIEGGGG